MKKILTTRITTISTLRIFSLLMNHSQMQLIFRKINLMQLILRIFRRRLMKQMLFQIYQHSQTLNSIQTMSMTSCLASRKHIKRIKGFKLSWKQKKNDDRKISAKLIKKKIRLKLNDCEIKHEFFWVKKRLHMLRKKSLQIDVIRHVHESL